MGVNNLIFISFSATEASARQCFFSLLVFPISLYLYPFCPAFAVLFISPDIGYPLFLDVVRTIKPTHIIQLHYSSYTQLGEVPFLSHGILNSAPGWSLKAKDPTPPQQLIKDVALFSEMISGRTKKDTNSRSPIMISSDEDEETGVDRVLTISLLSSESESEEEMDEKAEGE